MSASKVSKLAGAAAVTVGLALVPAGAAHAATKCDVGKVSRKLGPTYTLSLSVSGTSCRSGEKLVTAYYKCRVHHGGKKGKCTSTVLGYRCREHRGAAIPTQFDATVSCSKGHARVSHKYEQFT